MTTCLKDAALHTPPPIARAQRTIGAIALRCWHVHDSIHPGSMDKRYALRLTLALTLALAGEDEDDDAKASLCFRFPDARQP